MAKNRGISSEQKAKNAILTWLFDKKEQGSSNIVKTLSLEFSKVTVYKYLYSDHNSLVSLGLVERKAGSAKESFRPRYRITEKGKNYLIIQSATNVSLIITNLANIVEAIANDPEKILKLRKALNEISFAADEEVKALDHDPTLEEAKAICEKGDKLIKGPLTESLKKLYHICLEVTLPYSFRSDPRSGYKEGFVMGVSKEGGIYLIPIGLLKKHGLGIGL